MATKVEQAQTKIDKLKEQLVNAELAQTTAEAEDKLELVMAEKLGELSDGVCLKCEEALVAFDLDDAMPVGKVITFQVPDIEIMIALWPEIKEVLETTDIVLTPSKAIRLTKGESGLSMSLTDAKKTKSGGGGSKSGGNGHGKLEIPAEVVAVYPELEGKTSWKMVCDELNIAVGEGSAHRIIYAKNRKVHDLIPHDDPKPDYHPADKENGNGGAEETTE